MGNDIVDRGMIMGLGVGIVLCLMSASPIGAQSVAVGVRPEATTLARVSIDVVDAPLSDVIKTIARQAGLRLVWNESTVDPTTRVSVRARGIPANEAFARVLSGKGVRAEIDARSVTIVRDDGAAAVAQGGIVGKVMDAKTRQGLRGATISLSGVNRGAISGEDGAFRLSGVAPGAYIVQVKMLGFVKTTKSVTVVEGQTASVEIVLKPSVSALDQVVVTGTVVQTELKAVPNAITVITAKELEQRGITRIDQLFRGDVPGFFSMNSGSEDALGRVLMFSRGATGFSSNGASIPSQPIKTYVDGIELADPYYLSQIDPRSIERIEILTGPQASTIYGSNAINGVMQVFTKRGTSDRARVTLHLLSGIVQNNFSAKLTPTHTVDAGASGVEGRWSYSVGGSWDYLGAWTPAKQTGRLAGNGGVRAQFGSVTIDPSFRVGLTQNKANGSYGQSYYEEIASGRRSPIQFRSSPKRSQLHGQTAGLTVGFPVLERWRHEFVIGNDVSDQNGLYLASGYGSVSDSLVTLDQSHMSRASLRYATTAEFPLGPSIRTTITAGVDGWRTEATSFVLNTRTPTGTLNGNTSGTRLLERNAGGFIQGQLSFLDAMFVTYGLRAEWNPYYGEDAQPNLAPRVGAVWTFPAEQMTMKLRFSYGRSTRPPSKDARSAVRSNPYYEPYYGFFDATLANPELMPESQKGGEGGLELYFGNRASLVITRYNQTVDDLIQMIGGADSVRSLIPVPDRNWSTSGVLDAEGYGYQWQNKNVNVGAIRNQGWELSGRFNIGALSTGATYTWEKSRVIGITEIYRERYASVRFFQPGAPAKFFPEHTWAADIAYATKTMRIGVNVSGIGMMMTQDDAISYDNLRTLRLDVMRPRTFNSLPYNVYASLASGYVMADLSASRRLSSHLEGQLQVRNIGDFYRSDLNLAAATIGRQTKLGLKAIF